MFSSLKSLLSSLTVIVGMVGIASAEQREFTDVTGRTIKAEVIKVDGDSCILSIDNKEFTVPLAKLSPDDQKFLREWKAPPPTGRPQLLVNFSDRLNREEYQNEQIFDLSVIVENQDVREAFPGGKIEIIAIVRHAKDRGIYCIGLRESHPIGQIGKISKTTVKTKRYHCKYYTGEYAKGWRYHGHIAMLYNAEGKLVASSVSQGISGLERILEAPVHAVLDSNSRVLKNSEDKYYSYMMPEVEEEE